VPPTRVTGLAGHPDTLPAYSDIPITDIVRDHLGVRCVIDNDAVTAAIGEHTSGAGRGNDALLVPAAVFEIYGQRVGTGLGTLLTLLRPDRVVIGRLHGRWAVARSAWWRLAAVWCRRSW
jgi:predicted NBD/HSP70 family sugar kinase